MSIEYPYKKLVYLIQTNESIHLSDKSLYDIKSTLEQLERDTIATEGYWKKSYIELKEKQFPMKWNELRIKLARMKTEEMDDVLDLMHMLDDGVSIR